MRPSRIAAFALLASALVPFAASISSTAHAQDEGEEAPEQTGPKIEPSIKYMDRRSLVELMLPNNWKTEKSDEAKDELGRWVWMEGEATVGVVLCFNAPGAMRAPLFAQARAGANEVVDGSVIAGKGFIQQRFENAQGWYITERYVEKDGIVWVMQFVCHKTNWEFVEPVATAALDSFKVTGDYVRKDVTAGWETVKLKDFIVRTNVDADDADDAAALVDPFLDMRKYALKALPGKPFVEAPWQVYVILQGSLYEEIAIGHTGDKPDVGTYDPVERALLVKWMSRGTNAFDQLIMSRAASQVVTEHFGGSPPLWVNVGLRGYVLYLYEDGGKATKPSKDRMRTEVKPRVTGATKRLDQWFDLTGADVPDINAAQYELYGWHWFFRHAKQGKSWRKMYESSLEILRETGDPVAARAAWEGADFAEMREAFKSWGSSL